MQKDRYTVNEAAKILNLSPIAVHKRIERGQLSAEKIGRDFFILADVLEKTPTRHNKNSPRPRRSVRPIDSK